MTHVRNLFTKSQYACLGILPPLSYQIKPHGAVYGQTARSPELARAVVGVAKLFGVAFMGLAGTAHQIAAEEMDVKFIAGESAFFVVVEYWAYTKLL